MKLFKKTLKCSKLIHFEQQKIEFKPECLVWSCHYATGCFVAFLGDISILKSGWNLEKLFCCPALELFHCLPLWKTVLFVSSRAFLLSTPTFLFSTPVEKSEATWKKATKCNKNNFLNFPACFWIPIFFSNLNSNCSNSYERNLQEQVKKAFFFFYQKFFWSFTVWINCSSDLKNFANSQPLSFSITRTIFSHSRSEQFW